MILGFKTGFVPAVVAGTKPHTIRQGSNWREGMSIQFYKNVRQPSMEKIRPDAVALVVQEVELSRDNSPGRVSHLKLLVDGRELTPAERHELSLRDGFSDFLDLVRFFDNTHSLPFTGQLIGWTFLRY